MFGSRGSVESVKVRDGDPKFNAQSRLNVRLLIDLDFQLAHEPTVVLVVGPYKLGKFLGRAADRLEGRLGEAFTDFGVGKRLYDLGVEAHDDLLRGPGGSE